MLPGGGAAEVITRTDGDRGGAEAGFFLDPLPTPAYKTRHLIPVRREEAGMGKLMVGVACVLSGSIPVSSQTPTPVLPRGDRYLAERGASW
jgi:hypothetical protein